MKRFVIAILLATFSAGFSFSQDMMRIPYPMTMRQRGMGDAFTAVADDFYLLFTNPAGLSKVKNLKTEERNRLIQLPPLNLGIGVQNDLLQNMDTITSVFDSMDGGGDGDAGNPISAALDILGALNRSNFGFVLEDPLLSFGFIGPRAGFNVAPFLLDVNMKPVAGLRPELYLDVNAYLQAIAGFAPFHFSLFGQNNLHVGFAVKAVAAGQFEGSAELVDIFSWMEDTSLALQFLQENMNTGVGVGLNLGSLLELQNGLSFGLAALDFPTVLVGLDLGGVGGSGLQLAFPNIRTGVSYTVDWRRLGVPMPGFLLDNPVLAFDLANLVDTRMKVWAKTHLGLSVNVINLRFIALNMAAGLNKGYGTFSTTLKFFMLRLSYTLWQDENGIKVGDYPIWQHFVKLSLRW